MKNRFTPLSLVLVLGILAFSAQAKATGPQPEQGDNYKYDLGANNLSIFKLFTIQPEKKAPVRRPQQVSKTPAHKVESDKKDQIIPTNPSLDRVRR